MSRLMKIGGWLFGMFGGLIVFWAVLLAFGTKPAIAATILFVIVNGGRRVLTKQTLPPLYVGSAALAIGFGLIDLAAPTPFMLKWEPLIGNALVAGFFVSGALGKVPLAAQYARHSGKDIPLERPEVMRFMRFWTLLWATYFALRGVAFVWIMHQWPLVEALLIRKVAGWVTLAVMIGLSFAGRRVMRALQAIGLFRPAAPPPLPHPTPALAGDQP
jgi:intracellular septation protein A